MRLTAVNLKTNERYPSRRYYWYSLRMAKKLYRQEFGLVGKHNILFIKD